MQDSAVFIVDEVEPKRTTGNGNIQGHVTTYNVRPINGHVNALNNKHGDTSVLFGRHQKIGIQSQPFTFG
jgi:hypothetical protein